MVGETDVLRERVHHDPASSTQLIAENQTMPPRADGGVVLCDEYDDPTEQHVALVIAAAVPGVVHVQTRHRAQCPFTHTP